MVVISARTKAHFSMLARTITWGRPLVELSCAT